MEKFKTTVYDMEVVTVGGIFSHEKQLDNRLNWHYIALFSKN